MSPASGGKSPTVGGLPVSATFGPPTGQGWRPHTQWRREVGCACGYGAWEYWNPAGEPYVICRKCGRGKRATPEVSP